MNAVVDQLFNEFIKNPEEVGFAARANAVIAAYRPEQERKAVMVDPDRLNRTGVELSKLRKRCMNEPVLFITREEEKLREAHPEAPTWTRWDEVKTPDAMVKLQREWSKSTNPLEKALSELPCIPYELDKLMLTPEQKTRYIEISQDTEKCMIGKSTRFVWKHVRDTFLPGLKGTTFDEVVPALLLATGRRSAEILKTATFEKRGDKRALFTGQCKKAEGESKPYEIDLLAPADDVITALAVVRRLCPAADMTVEMAKVKWGVKVQRAVKKKMKINPHKLRAINATACFHLYNQNGMSLIGYLQKQLGHEGVQSSARYQNVELIMDEHADVKTGLVGRTRPEKNKIAQISAMMAGGQLITATIVVNQVHGCFKMIKRLIEEDGMNAAIIARHNQQWAAPAVA